MKKILLFALIITMLFTQVTAMAVSLEIDGVKVKSNMLFEDSTAYVPLSSIAKAIGAPLDRDEKTQSVFVNGINLFATKGENVTVYVNGKKYTPSDSSMGAIVNNGEVYLPAHLAAEAFGKEAVWYEATATLVLSTPQLPVEPTVIDENTTYVIVNRGTGKVLSSTGNSLITEAFSKSDNQKFKLVKTEFEGYYHIQATSTGFNLDVNAHGTTPGVSIITWEMGTGDNQKFLIEDVAGGTIISARSCHLPIEPSQGGVIQNTRNDESANQKWSIVPFNSYTEAPAKKAVKLKIEYTPTEEDLVQEENDAAYRTFSIGDVSLSDIDGLKVSDTDNSDAQKWTLVEHSPEVYVITNLATNKSMDVSARSLEEGGSIITYNTSSDINQRWILEQNGDGSYYIKSVHSSLYLTVKDDNTLIQAAKDTSLKQRWTMDKVN